MATVDEKAGAPIVSEPGNDSTEKKDIIDAGLRSYNHYKKALPRWRYNLRQKLIPLVRLETSHLARFQAWARSPFWDSYFAITANLGTHTAFMVGLPVLFWCGFEAFGKGLVHILAAGVFFSGFIKDMLSLPRPLSPPLHRITMSGSAALEYGFPSTHSTNAVSVAVYGVLKLWDESNTYGEGTKLALELLSYFYALSIVIGRLYCGMHGFLDVIVGSSFGAAIGWAEFAYGPALDQYMYNSSWLAPVVCTLVIIILIRIHPEPADDCPCFDDSVSFAGVVIGLEFGTWSYGRALFDTRAPIHLADNVDAILSLGLPIIIARLVFGVLIIVVWREVMKPTLLKFLPHIFRFSERAGLILPRRFFSSATKYDRVPGGVHMDTLFPRVKDITGAVENIRKAGRGRSVSVGPQSAADAYETLVYRERRRRESIESNGSLKSKTSRGDLWEGQKQKEGAVLSEREGSDGEKGWEESDNDEVSDGEVFRRLVTPRVRYDVEVVTKLVVYTGIGWLSTYAIPLLFEVVGMGLGRAVIA